MVKEETVSNGLGRVESESESHLVVSGSLRPHGLYSPWNSPGQNTGMRSHFLLQEIFPTQGLSPGLLHCRQILYQLSHQGNQQMLVKLLQLAIMRTSYHPQVRRGEGAASNEPWRRQKKKACRSCDQS